MATFQVAVGTGQCVNQLDYPKSVWMTRAQPPPLKLVKPVSPDLTSSAQAPIDSRMPLWRSMESGRCRLVGHLPRFGPTQVYSGLPLTAAI